MELFEDHHLWKHGLSGFVDWCSIINGLGLSYYLRGERGGIMMHS